MGLYAAMGLNRRAAALEEAGRLLAHLATRIRYTAAPIGELLCEVAGHYRRLPFLREAGRLVDDGADFHSAWGQALRQKGEESGLTAADRELLLRFGEGLGRTDVEGQLAHCELYTGLLADKQAEAKAQTAAKGRLYVTLGVAGGLAAALLLL